MEIGSAEGKGSGPKRNEERGTRNEGSPAGSAAINGLSSRVVPSDDSGTVREWRLPDDVYTGSHVVREQGAKYGKKVTSEVRSFEDIIAWQKARVLAKELFKVTRRSTEQKDFSFSDQLRRAAISTMSNISEGHERTSTPEFLHFLSIAKGSAAEVRSLLYVALDLNYISEQESLTLIGKAHEVGRIIGGLMVALRRHVKQ